MRTGNRGFTLIELLIVVAIIAILAAIAVPNFLEAQVRSKVARAKNDMRSIATGLESYAVDNGKYPPTILDNGNGQHLYYYEALLALTTPVAFMTTIPTDPFVVADRVWEQGFVYYNRKNRGDWAEAQHGVGDGDTWWFIPLYPENYNYQWILRSFGPDGYENWTHVVNYGAPQDMPQMEEYDASNGSMSFGDIIRMGP